MRRVHDRKCQSGKAGNNEPSSPYAKAKKKKKKKFTGVSTEQVPPLLMPAPRGAHVLSHLIPTTTTAAAAESSLGVTDWPVCAYHSPVFADKTLR